MSRAGISKVALLTYTVLLGACQPGVLDPAGPVGAGERSILLNSLSVMLAIVIPTIVLTLVFAWWFRASNTRAKYRPEWSYSGRLELLVWSIPMLVIFFLGGITWIGSHDLDPRKPLPSEREPIRIDVVAMDWKWLFIYPQQGIASVNHLVIPLGTPVHFRITSATVMNSFFIPQLGSQIYAMAGMSSQLNLQADIEGRYEGLSSHYSGDGFADMNFPVDAVSVEAFADWKAEVQKAGPLLDHAAYTALAHTYATAKSHTYRAVTANLFAFALHDARTAKQQSTTTTGGEY